MITVIGTTTWGTTLSILLARKGISVKLWARTEREAEELNKRRENPYLLPGIPFPPLLSVTHSLEEAFSNSNIIILAVPAQTMRRNARMIKEFVSKNAFILSVAKGLEMETGKRMSEVIAEEIPQNSDSICVLSGPSLAKEIIRGLPAASVLAGRGEITRRAKELLNSPLLFLQESEDIIGVELGGALKNIFAIGAGMIEGLGYGDNAKAAFIIQGLEEMITFGKALGADPKTFYGLSGLGDLIVTCFSPLSRNHFVGLELAKGRPLKEITATMREVAEGITTTKASRKLAERLSLKLPIIEQVYKVLYEGIDPKKAMSEIFNESLFLRR